MNVNDVKDDVIPPSLEPYDQLANMLGRQSALEDFYWKLENRPSKVIAINSRQGQVIIKDFLWRIVEEVGEFLEARVNGHHDHSEEELADGLHFVLGLAVITGKEHVYHQVINDYKYGSNGDPTREEIMTELTVLIEFMGRLGNCLKMKPWKQTDVLTDENKFDLELAEVFRSYLDLFTLFCTPTEIYKMYWKKSEVNLFRQRSKY